MKQIVKPKKSLGQHFLKDREIADQIAASIESYKSYPVVEVGPGMGILTQCLIDRGFDLRVVELDHEAVDYLRASLPSWFIQENRLIEGDILRIPPNELIAQKPDAPFVLIGNYPYNISGRLFYQAFLWRERIPCIAGMLQKEVAQRIAATPGGKDYGILSVLLQSHYQAEYLFTVDREEFSPPPKVHGGVLRLSKLVSPTIPQNEKLFIDVVKSAFSQRRKTLRNALKSLFVAKEVPSDHPREVADLLQLRAERLTVEQFLFLTDYVATYQK